MTRYPLRSVAAVALPGVSPFELSVLCEVFGIDRTGDGVPAFDFAVVAERPGLVPMKAGLTIDVAHGLDRAAEADVVAIAARPADLPTPEAVKRLVRETVERGARVLSICTAAFVLAEAGLLDGRPCTTHWMYTADLAARHPRARVDPDVLYVDDGAVVTSAGTAAGIDACLHLVRQAHGATAAARIARRMVVPPHRDGGQAQYVATPLPRAADDGIAALQEWALARLDEDLSVERLARRALVSPRTLARRFTESCGATPAAWVARMRLQRAQELLETTSLPVDAIAAEVGWGTGAVLRHHFGKLGTTPLAYRRTFAGPPARASA
ncbi:GlxA family transcriptional regulator [Blastococcus sp. URHD0036]|uniref:GlxA family transcriptional regulator n=1 Tax=Blastococcus sp. URHD0036 TaxID=1380356 RepID=UPI000A6524DF|nr:helix-turn-helix domain-containing protein [Blastococcus sp. URHD0036]